MTGNRLRAAARVDLDAVRANVEALRARAAGAEVMAVVKADGYGHGLLPAARAALAGGASWLGVAVVEEALALRAGGVSAPVLAWLAAPGERWTDAIAADVDLSVNAGWGVEEIAAAAESAGRPARLHLKADTGLGRGGCGMSDWPELLAATAKAVAAGYVELVGVWSHLAYADEPGHPTVAAQIQTFRDAVEQTERAGLRPQLRHLANSAATLTLPEAHLDLVRPGIAVYGLTPVPQEGGPERYGLRPAMTFTARLALVKPVGQGQGVSYGHAYTTAADTTLGLVPVGYADGVPRHGGNRLEVYAAGRRRRVAGRVCMDQFMLDLGDDAAAAGDEVVLFGPGDHGEPTAQDWADTLGTISYEVVTGVGARVPRTYTEAYAGTGR
jgi:alanine racemase